MFSYRDGYIINSEEWEVIDITGSTAYSSVKWDNYFYAWVEAQRRNQQEKAR
jgi:hypothetical protein